MYVVTGENDRDPVLHECLAEVGRHEGGAVGEVVEHVQQAGADVRARPVGGRWGPAREVVEVVALVFGEA